MLLLEYAIKFYENAYLSEKGKVPTRKEILAFKKCEKDLQRLIRKMRVKRRKN
jgi:hypothetical protein